MPDRNANREFCDFVLDQLAEMDYLRCKPMFGGYGLYLMKVFFGIVYDARLYLRVNPDTQPLFDAAGSETFRPKPGLEIKSYREAPADTLENAQALAELACLAAELPRSQARKGRCF